MQGLHPSTAATQNFLLSLFFFFFRPKEKEAKRKRAQSLRWDRLRLASLFFRNSSRSITLRGSDSRKNNASLAGRSIVSGFRAGYSARYVVPNALKPDTLIRVVSAPLFFSLPTAFCQLRVNTQVRSYVPTYLSQRPSPPPCAPLHYFISFRRGRKGHRDPSHSS